MRIAYFTPLNPQKSGISDYSEELLPYLAERIPVDVYTDAAVAADHPLRRICRILPTDAFVENRHQYDLPVYQMGNAPHHAPFWDLLLAYPGLTVLHDFVLFHFVKWRTLGCNNVQAFLEEMEYAHGTEGLRRARELVMDGKEPDAFSLPCNRRILEASPHVIVHSKFTAGQVQRVVPGLPTTVVPMHMEASPPASAAEVQRIRGHLRLRPDALVLASFGHIIPNKRVVPVLRAFAELRREMPHAVYVLVGELAEGSEIPGVIQQLGLREAVRITGYVSMDEFRQYLAACDIAINLRYPTAGETSASVLRIMAAGRPVLVSNVGFYSELPDEATLKMPVDSTEERAILAGLRRLAGSAELRNALGAAAWHYICEQHHPRVTAAGYEEAIRQAVVDRADLALLNGLADRVGDELGSLGIQPSDDQFLERVAGTLVELGIRRSRAGVP